MPTAAACRGFAQGLAQSVSPAASAAAGNASKGACGYGAARRGTFLAGMAPGAPAAGWKTLALAQAWCCAHPSKPDSPGVPATPGCGGVTCQNGSYTARESAAPTANPLKGLVSWVRGGTGGGGGPFSFKTGASSAMPSGCSLTVTNATSGAVEGFFNTQPASTAPCGGKVGARRVAGAGAVGGVGLTVAMDEAAGQVTITMSGPSAVWFGAAFGAESMETQPYAIVVDGQGKVSEHQLGVHAPGVVLQPTVAVKASSVAAGVRTVVLTRKLSLQDYEASYYNFDVATTELPYLTALGKTGTFAYHKSHAVASLKLLARGGAATCVCAGRPPPFGKTADGKLEYDAAGTDGKNSSVGFGKACVGDCAGGGGPESCSKSSTMIIQRNPTCDVRDYKGGLGCCHHQYYLTDKNQSGLISPQVLAYHMKMRFYFQSFDAVRHQQLYRWHFQTAMGAGEYDVPRCSAGTPAKACIHEISARIRVSGT